MNNFKIDVIAETQDTLFKALEIAFAHNAPGFKMESYHVTKLVSDGYNGLPTDVDGKKAIVFRWTVADRHIDGGPINLPFKLDAKGAADFAQRWLLEQDFGREPDHDGHNERGWRVITGNWGHICGDRYSICAVLPWWAAYGK